MNTFFELSKICSENSVYFKTSDVKTCRKLH